MSARRPPDYERRRYSDFEKELRDRARAWIPSWGLADGERDFGRALLEVAARFSAEVAERLDRAGDKMARGFLDWLAVRGEAARPARMPVVFRLADTAREPVLAPHPARMQVDARGTSVMFETETDVQLVPGRLELVVAVDPAKDAFYLPPPGLSSLEPIEPLPTRWQTRSFAATGSTKLQLDPELGLTPETILEAAGQQYRITEANKDIVTIDPKLDAGLDEGTEVRKVTSFVPFDGSARNRQEHVLHLGHTELLNIEADALLDVVGAQGWGESVKWEYWGKLGQGQEAGWQELAVVETKQQKDDALVLVKPKGAIEPRDIDGKSSRWVRGFKKTITETTALVRTDDLSLRVNCSKEPPPTPPVAEGMANTTPLVLDGQFFPFGKEPRQFDAFYLGSAEAFSKKNAQVKLQFGMADASFEALACLRTGPLANQFLAGVAKDGYLYLLSFDPGTGRPTRYDARQPMRPPSPGPFGATVPAPPVTLDQDAKFRPALWAIEYGFARELLVAVTAAGSVWVWREVTLIPPLSGWESLGTVGQSNQPIEGLVYLADTPAGVLVVLRDSKLFVRDLANPNPVWRHVETKDGATAVNLKKIAPIYRDNVDLGAGFFDEGLVGVDENEKLYTVELAGAQEGACTELLSDITPEVAPAAVRRSADDKLVVVAVSTAQPTRKLRGFLSPSTDIEVDLPGIGVVGSSIDVNLNAGFLTFALCLKLDEQSTALAYWSPFDNGVSDALFTTGIPIEVGGAGGAPTLLPAHVVVPGSAAQLLVAEFDINRRLALNTNLRTALITTTLADRLEVGDRLAIRHGTPADYHRVTVTAPGIDRRGEILHEFAFESTDDDVFVYRAAVSPLTGEVVDLTQLDELTLDASDNTTDEDTILLIQTDQSTEPYRVISTDDTVTPRVARLDSDLDIVAVTSVSYWLPQSTGARLVPLMRLDPATTGAWDAALLDFTYLIFPGATPERQKGAAFEVDTNRRPILVALADQWTTPPPPAGPAANFIVDGTVANWTGQLGDTSSNPELSWEYWNGTGWWKLDDIRNGEQHFTDATGELKHSGTISFKVPADLRPTDWSGRTNHWIRARLVGGDYGRERVTVKTLPATPPATSQQVVERSSEDIHAPSVLRLQISYNVCDPVKPDFVLTKDGGTTRDQSDANRTGGAIVEAFVPLSVQLGRLAGGGSAPKADEECAPECDCPGMTAAQPAPAKAVSSAASTGEATPAGDRALYLGFTSKLIGQPVNVLLVVERESAHDQIAPMRIDALVSDTFVPVVAKDETRAIGETGMISMSFSVTPIPAGLFGRSLSWVRLTPKDSSVEWKPALRGAYLNAVWARAAETMTRELVGSSEGAPRLTLRLARPPLLAGSLELRVREPLGKEERDLLVEGDPDKVKSNVPDLPGHWVLWTQVDDPLDHDPGARVYSLDEGAGVILFGDGLHGAIPPIGVDAIVAFKYERTEPATAEGVPANFVAARLALNLVTPIESVETAIAADQAAGGVAPESDERVLQFGAARLRHRGRAVTAQDFEDLALQRFADVVQARCFTRGGRVRLVVVMRGADPKPSRAQQRELRRMLLALAPPALWAPRMLRIEGPNVRRLRIDLELQVASLDVAGELAKYVERTLKAFFDTDTGGADREGWALGLSPREDDIAEALLDAPHLDGFVKITLSEVDAGGGHTWPQSIKADDLVMLADDGIRIRFKITEADE